MPSEGARRPRGRHGRVQVGEAEIDGDAARLLFREAIGIGAGERLDKRAFAVIDMTCGGDDEMLLSDIERSKARRPTARSAPTTSASWRGKTVRRSSLTVAARHSR